MEFRNQLQKMQFKFHPGKWFGQQVIREPSKFASVAQNVETKKEREDSA